MPMEQGQSQDDDLDRTAKLPILEGVSFDFDFDDEEDAVKLDSPGYSGNLVKSANSGNFGDRGGRGPVALGSVPGEISKHSPLDLPSLADSLGDRGPVALSAVRGEFSKHSPVDLPSLAESMRSVEARIASQHADYEALHRSYERAQGAESVAAARADALERELAGARTALEGELSSARSALELERLRSLRLQQSLAETSSAVELGRSTTEAALREAERHRAESRTLRDSLAARDATVVQVLHSLGERDAQLAALKTEHAKLLPTLDARARSASQLEGELNATRSRLSALGAQLKTEQEMAAALKMELRRSDAEVKTLRADVSAAAMQTARYLEQLRTREWRRGFDQNLLREPDGQIGPADFGSEALKSESDRLQQQLSDCEEKTAALRAEIAARDRTLNEAHAATEAQALRVSAVTASLEQVKSQHAARIAEYEAAAKTHEEELNVLIVHLQEARRPVEAIVGDVRRLKDELLAKDAAYDSLAEQLRESRAELERTRGALQEREFLIRRLERSETNNATALGRIQNSMERLGSVVGRPVAPTAVLPPSTPDLPNSAASPTTVLPIVPPASSATGAAPSSPPNTVLSPDAQQWPAQLIRIEGDCPIAHALGRRTRVGRAPSCELQIDAASVSRHHALIVLSGNEAIIEDLNSTNGVFVNGRKVTRQAVNDGDVVTIGDVPFKFALNA